MRNRAADDSPRYLIRRQPNHVWRQRYAWKVNPHRYPMRDIRAGGWLADGFTHTLVGALWQVETYPIREWAGRMRDRWYPAKEWTR